MTPAASVFTCSYNKPDYVGDAIASVLAQEFGDFEYWILENSDDGGKTRAAVAPYLSDPRIVYEEIDLTGEDREGCYPPAMLLNRYYAKANGRYIFYLSDDDLFEPACLARCVAELDADPAKSVVWFTLWRTVLKGGRFRPAGSIPAVCEAGRGSRQPKVDCRVDGGQVAHRRECLDLVGWPWFPEEPHWYVARHSDGVFLQKLADLFTFHPIPECLMIHRVTPDSTWDKPAGRS